MAEKQKVASFGKGEFGLPMPFVALLPGAPLKLFLSSAPLLSSALYQPQCAIHMVRAEILLVLDNHDTFPENYCTN